MQLVKEDYESDFDTFNIINNIVYAHEKEVGKVIAKQLKPVLLKYGPKKREELASIFKRISSDCAKAHRQYANSEILNGLECAKLVVTTLFDIEESQQDSMKSARGLYEFAQEAQRYLISIAQSIVEQSKETAQKAEQIRQELGGL